MGKTFLLLSVGLCVSVCQSVSASTWYVDGSVVESGDGGSWETAFREIQEGIDAAGYGDTVIVKQGTYIENIQFEGKNITLASTDPLDPDVVADTVINGDQAGPAVTFVGTEDPTCVLAGFTIRNGKALNGGGILGGKWSWPLPSHTQATIRKCDGTIQNNVISANQGGGLYGCDGMIRNNVISKNTAVHGAGLCDCDGEILNNTIIENVASGWLAYGGGLAFCEGTIANCIIWGNRAPVDQQIRESSVPTYSCIQGWRGGGIGNISAYPHFVDPDAGDYHLRTWSPCVDAGDRSSDFSREPLPNGARVNMGAYGNTPEAALSSPDTDRDLLPDDWEMSFFSSLTWGASDDPDGDGWSNLQEYFQGAIPTRFVTWFVDQAVASSGDGTSRETAFKSIQQGIDAALAWDIVVVAEGTYEENVLFRGRNITLTGADPLSPSVVANTVLDGQGKGSVVTFSGLEDETSVLTGFTIRNGNSEDGGGVAGSGTRATIERNVITGNLATSQGGGLWDCDGRIENNRVVNNETYWTGGGLASCDGVIQSNLISGNSSTDGGGLSECLGTIQNNVIAGNSGYRGGGLHACDGEIRNNTIVSNSASGASFSCGGLNRCKGRIVNCILWENTGPTLSQLYESAEPIYSCLGAWTTGGVGCISEDPRFMHPYGPDADYHLAADSPCIDAGRNESWMWDATDLDGKARILVGRSSMTVDMGAYEYGSFAFRLVGVPGEDGKVQLTWGSRPGDTYVVWSASDLSAANPWTAEATVASGGETTSWTDPDTASTRKFYRIEVK